MTIRNSFLILVLFVLFVCVFYFVYSGYTGNARYIFPPIGAEKGAELGQLGDYFGGLLNPLIGLVTVVFVFLAFLQQRYQLELAKTEHKINVLQDERRYLFSEISTLLQKNGFDVGDDLLTLIGCSGKKRNADVSGDLGKAYLFSYFKLACEAMRMPEDCEKQFLNVLKKRLDEDLFVVSRLVINCKMAACLKTVSSDLMPLIKESSGIGLSVQTELNQVEDIFNALSIDYMATAINGNEIVWLN